jgi:hypothetical protein
MSSPRDFALQVRKGIAAARSGRSDEARRLLQTVVRADPDNEMAWLWLSGLMPTDHQKRDCLEHVLRANPRNGYARAGLVRLQETIRTEEEVLEARLSSATGKNGHSLGLATLTGDAVGVTLPSRRREAAQSRPVPGAKATEESGEKPEGWGASSRKGQAAKRQSKPVSHSYLTTCPSCDQPLPYTATACPHCFLTFTPLGEAPPPAQAERSSFGRSLRSGLCRILSRLRILS